MLTNLIVYSCIGILCVDCDIVGRGAGLIVGVGVHIILVHPAAK